MRLHIALLLALLELGARAETSASSSVCSAVQRELESSQCGDVCGAFVPCIIFDRSTDCDTTACVSDDDGLCQYACVEYLLSSFKFFIPFGTEYQIEEGMADRAIDNEAYDVSETSAPNGDDADGYFTINSDLLDAIGTLQLNPYTPDVTIIGGIDQNSQVKGHVVNVSFKDAFMSNNSQVATVSLCNLNLKTVIDDLPILLPSNVSTLNLKNALLYEFPMGFAEFPSLESLTLNLNYLNAVGPINGFNALRELEIANNSVSVFEALFRNLESLDLAYNNLTEIPAVTSRMSSLSELDLSFNGITTVDKAYSSDSLKFLLISSNSISSFEASLPNLQELTLNNNQLTAIPDAVFTYKNLASLSLSGNPISLNFTVEQLEFLRGLAIFDVDTDGLSWDCNVTKVSGHAVCVIDADTNSTSTETELRPSLTFSIVAGVVSGIGFFALLATVAFIERLESTPTQEKPIATTYEPIVLDRSPVDLADITSADSRMRTDPGLPSLQHNPTDAQKGSV